MAPSLLVFGLALQIASTAPAPPGRLVKVDGIRVHVRCIGRGRPPVVFLHGLGDYSFDWMLVQPAVAQETEACAYDRPGQAWSDPGPAPRGIQTSARELHAMLRRMRLKAPYVLVGHSWGGLIARLYAHDYAKEVAGMVLVDSAHEDEYLWINGKIVQPRMMTDQEWSDLIAPRKRASDENRPAPPPRPRPAITKLDAPYDKLPSDAQKLRMWAMSLPWRNGGGDTDDMRRDFIAMHDVTAASEHPLGGIPLIVLSKTPGIDDDDDYKPEQLQWNRQLQDQLATLSTNGEHVVAPHSGHHIQLEEPELVIDAIRRVVDSVRGARPMRRQSPPTR